MFREWRFLGTVLDWLYPQRCELCARIGQPALCPQCLSEFEPTEPLIAKSVGGNPLDLTASLYAFDGRAAQAVKRLKYSRATALAKPMAVLLSECYETAGLPEFDAIVPVPIHWTRRYARGFNQSEMLCEGFPKGLVQQDLLKRSKNTRPQVGLSREERLNNLKGAFEGLTKVRGLRLLLIDDVTTTGGTATACAIALKDAGAEYVGILTFCGSDDQASGERRP